MRLRRYIAGLVANPAPFLPRDAQRHACPPAAAASWRGTGLLSLNVLAPVVWAAVPTLESAFKGLHRLANKLFHFKSRFCAILK